MKTWSWLLFSVVLLAVCSPGAVRAQGLETVLTKDQIEAADPDQLSQIGHIRRLIDAAADDARYNWRTGDCDGFDRDKKSLLIMATPADGWVQANAGEVKLRRSQIASLNAYADKLLTQIAGLGCPPPASVTSTDADLLFKLDRRGRLVPVDTAGQPDGQLLLFKLNRRGELVPVESTGAPPAKQAGLDIPPTDRCLREGAMSGAGFYYIPGTDTCLRVGGYVRAESFFLGDQMGMGTVVNPPNDSFFLQPDRSLVGLGAGGSFTFRSPDWRHTLSFGYASATAGYSAEEPDGGEQIGYVPGSSVHGDGFNFGDFGFKATNDLDFRHFNVAYSATRPYGGDLPGGDGGLRYSGGLIASFQGFTLDSDAHLERTPDPDNIYVNVSQQHTGWAVGVGPKINLGWPLGSGISFYGSADLQAVVRQSSLTSWETMCVNCAGSPTMISVDDNLTNLGVQASATGAIMFKLPDDWRLKLTGGITAGDFHVIDVRLNPKDADTHIASQWGVQWNAGVRFERSW